MRTILLTAAAALIAAPALAETRTFDITGFKKIEAGSAFEIEFRQASAFSVVVESRYDNMDKITVEKVGDTLRIHRPNNTNIPHKVHDIVRISAPDLDAIKLHSAVEFSADGLDVDRLEIDTHSAIKLDIGRLKAQEVDLRGHSASKFSFDGACGKLSIDIDSASSVDASGLRCRQTDITAGTASFVHAWASDKAVVEAGLASRVTISGKPKDFQKSQAKFSSRIELED